MSRALGRTDGPHVGFSLGKWWCLARVLQLPYFGPVGEEGKDVIKLAEGAA